MNIEIDFEVYKELTRRRATEDMSYNDVLREVLKMNPLNNPLPLKQISGNDGWLTKGVHFPNGTEFRATYKNQTYYGKVESGALIVDNNRFNSPSAAAVKITGNPVNGWIFWECRIPGESSWKIIKSRRKERDLSKAIF
jgi:hypothetical protein